MKTTLNRVIERTQKTAWTKVRAAILATLLGFGVNWMAQNIQPDEQPHTQTEVVKKDTRISVHGMLSLWTNWIAWDAAEVCSTNPTLIGVLKIRDQKTWLGFTTVRLDDGQDDSEQPASRVTILNPNFCKKFWKNGEFSVSIDWKYAMFDKMPNANWFSPDIVWSWTPKNGLTFEWMYSHKFKKWADSDAFRLSVTKQIDDIVKLTAQWWYDTGCDSHFYGRLICDVKLGNWLWAQVSLISKNWKLVPTGAIIYTF